MNMKCAAFAGIIAAAALLAGGKSAHAGDAFCREYTRNIFVGGRIGQGYGTACLQPDGSWRVTAGQDAVPPQPQKLFRYGAVSYAAPPPPPHVVYVYDRPHYRFVPPGHRHRHDRHRHDWREHGRHHHRW